MQILTFELFSNKILYGKTKIYLIAKESKVNIVFSSNFNG